MRWQLTADALKALLTAQREWISVVDDDFRLDLHQKGVDMRIGLDIASLAYKRQVNQVVLISGDSDFVPAAKLARHAKLVVAQDALDVTPAVTHFDESFSDDWHALSATAITCTVASTGIPESAPIAQRTAWFVEPGVNFRCSRPMRKLILQMQMSVDGFVSSDGAHRWQVWGWGDDNGWDEALKQDFNAHFQAIDTILLSRKMAEEGYLTHWGKAARRYPQDPFYAFAKRITEVAKVVPTDKLKESRWERTTVCSGDLPREVNALKGQKGGNIAVFGGASFASALYSAGLVDEFQFYINPAALGGGTRLFDGARFHRLRLVRSKAYDCGVVVNCYAPAARPEEACRLPWRAPYAL